MREGRETYPAGKAQMYRTLQEEPRRHRVVALVRMEKVRASQILPLRKKLKGDVSFVSIKDKVARKALEGVGGDVPGIGGMAAKVEGQCMFMFTDMSPFKLNVVLSKNTVMLPARAGDTASIDVVVPAKNTGIAPGPMLTVFKDAGIPTKIDQGTIWITKDTVPVKKGGVIGENLAPLLAKLDIKPVEAGISLDSALEDGVVYSADELVVDVAAVRDGLGAAHAGAMALSVEAAYPTAGNIAQILARAAQRASSLSVEAAFMTPDTGGPILQRAHSQALALQSAAEEKGYSA